MQAKLIDNRAPAQKVRVNQLKIKELTVRHPKPQAHALIQLPALPPGLTKHQNPLPDIKPNLLPNQNINLKLKTTGEDGPAGNIEGTDTDGGVRTG